MADSSVQDLEKLFKEVKSARARLEPEWYLNLAYFIGDQWVFWNHGRIDRPQLSDGRIRFVDNRILPVATARVSRKVKNRPQFVATLNSYDEDDLRAAEIGERVLDDDWINLNLHQKLYRALNWAEICSAGFWKIYWDGTKGSTEEYVIDPNGQVFTGQRDEPVRAADAGPLLEAEGFSSKSIALGNVQIDVLSPFNFYGDPLAEELDECEIIFEENIRSPEYVKKHYNIEIEGDTNIPTGIAESRMFPSIISGGGTNEYKGITVKELYAKEGSKYGSTGKRCVWAKDQTLLEETLDEAPFAGNPYIMFPGIEVPGRFWPTCITTQLRGPQTELNKIKSQIRENANRIGNPSLAIARQANVKYSGLPGEQVFYDATIPDALPSFLKPPEMPQYIQNEIMSIEQSITEISGLHEVSKASVPSGVTAASAINLLMEADETRLGPEIESMEKGLGKAGTKILQLRVKFQDDERTIQSVGDDGEWDIAKFRGKMLGENPSVIVQAGSAMPRSKAARQAAMQEILGLALQYGLDIRPRDLRKFLREYGVGGLENMFAGISHDEQQIKREHNIMKNGVALDINDFDDDDLHIEGHDEYRKSKSYWNDDEKVKKIFDVHVNAHMERRQLAIDAQVQTQRTEALT